MVDFQPSILLWIEHICNAAWHFGFLTGSLLASFGPHHMWGYSSFSHIITQSIEFPFSYFYATTTELSAQWASVSLTIQPTVVLIADLSQATFWVFKKLLGRICGWQLHPELNTIHLSNSRCLLPLWDSVGEHICRMTVSSVYHPLRLR